VQLLSLAHHVLVLVLDFAQLMQGLLLELADFLVVAHIDLVLDLASVHLPMLFRVAFTFGILLDGNDGLVQVANRRFGLRFRTRRLPLLRALVLLFGVVVLLSVLCFGLLLALGTLQLGLAGLSISSLAGGVRLGVLNGLGVCLILRRSWVSWVLGRVELLGRWLVILFLPRRVVVLLGSLRGVGLLSRVMRRGLRVLGGSRVQRDWLFRVLSFVVRVV